MTTPSFNKHIIHAVHIAKELANIDDIKSLFRRLQIANVLNVEFIPTSSPDFMDANIHIKKWITSSTSEKIYEKLLNEYSLYELRVEETTDAILLCYEKYIEMDHDGNLVQTQYAKKLITLSHLQDQIIDVYPVYEDKDAIYDEFNTDELILTHIPQARYC